MTALQNNIINPNLLSQINFRVLMKRTPTLNFLCTDVELPGCNLPSPAASTPFVPIPEPGDHLDFDPLSITFLVDEDFLNWIEVHSWIRSISHADNFEQYKALDDQPQWTGLGVKSDIVVSVLDSARNANFNITYYDAFPISVSKIVFTSSATGVKHIKCNATFAYINWDYQSGSDL
jgi:hypothetical protein